MRRVLIAAGLGVLVLTNVVLLTAVVRADRAPDVGPAPTSPSAAAPTPSASAEAESVPTDLYAAGNGALFRAVRGSCADDARARIDVTTDDGATFEEVGLPVLSEPDEDTEVMRTVLAMSADSSSDLILAGNDTDCDTVYFASEDGGDSWEPRESFPGWFVPASGDEVMSPDGPVTPDCDAERVDPVSDINAKILCADGSVLGTNDGGLTWTFLGALPAATDISFTSVADGVALGSDDDCASRAFGSGDAGGTWDPLGCVDETAASSALVGRGGELLALAGGEVRVSDDGGTTWDSPAEE